MIAVVDLHPNSILVCIQPSGNVEAWSGLTKIAIDSCFPICLQNKDDEYLQ